MGETEIRQFLSDLAIRLHVCVSTQTAALVPCYSSIATCSNVIFRSSIISNEPSPRPLHLVAGVVQAFVGASPRGRPLKASRTHGVVHSRTPDRPLLSRLTPNCDRTLHWC